MVRTDRMVITTETIRDSSIPFATLLLTRSVLPAPKACEVRTVKPVVRPWEKPSTRNMMVPVAPTAASASALTKRPTIMVSAML